RWPRRRLRGRPEWLRCEQPDRESSRHGSIAWLGRRRTLMSWQVTRRQFLGCVAALGAFAALPATAQAVDWRDLLPNYLGSARRNIVTVNGRRALLSSRPYPGTYVRDAVFWGPLALEDPALGYECYSWFEENQLPSGQIPTAVPLAPEEAPLLVPQDDE